MIIGYFVFMLCVLGVLMYKEQNPTNEGMKDVKQLLKDERKAKKHAEIKYKYTKAGLKWNKFARIS